MNKYCVYKHTFPNGKVYIGITCQKPHERWESGYGYKNQSLVFNAIKKYGWNNVAHEIICDGLSLSEAHAKEIEQISIHKSDNRDFGYNVSSGGFSGSSHTVSDDARRRIGDSHRGKPLSEEHKEKLRKAHVGIKLGRPSAEAIKHRQEGGVGRPRKPVAQYSKTGEFIRCWDAILFAATTLGISQTNIIMVCNGKRKTAGGFVWAYANGGD